MALSIDCKSAEISSRSMYKLTISADGVDVSQILGQITIDQIIDNFPAGKLLDAIGMESARDHFDHFHPED